MYGVTMFSCPALELTAVEGAARLLRNPACAKCSRQKSSPHQHLHCSMLDIYMRLTLMGWMDMTCWGSQSR